MTRLEAREACKKGCPVIHNGIEYLYISAITYRRGPNGFYMQAELLDRNKKDVVIVNPAKVAVKE